MSEKSSKMFNSKNKLTNLEQNDVLFIDEIHRLSPVVEEVLYPAMEDYQLDIMIGEGPAARSIKIDLPAFTLVGATTRSGLLTSPRQGFINNGGKCQQQNSSSWWQSLNDLGLRSIKELHCFAQPANPDRAFIHFFVMLF